MRSQIIFLKVVAITLCFTFSVTSTIAYGDSSVIIESFKHNAWHVTPAFPGNKPAQLLDFARKADLVVASGRAELRAKELQATSLKLQSDPSALKVLKPEAEESRSELRNEEGELMKRPRARRDAREDAAEIEPAVETEAVVQAEDAEINYNHFAQRIINEPVGKLLIDKSMVEQIGKLNVPQFKQMFYMDVGALNAYFVLYTMIKENRELNPAIHDHILTEEAKEREKTAAADKAVQAKAQEQEVTARDTASKVKLVEKKRAKSQKKEAGIDTIERVQLAPVEATKLTQGLFRRTLSKYKQLWKQIRQNNLDKKDRALVMATNIMLLGGAAFSTMLWVSTDFGKYAAWFGYLSTVFLSEAGLPLFVNFVGTIDEMVLDVKAVNATERFIESLDRFEEFFRRMPLNPITEKGLIKGIRSLPAEIQLELKKISEGKDWDYRNLEKWYEIRRNQVIRILRKADLVIPGELENAPAWQEEENGGNPRVHRGKLLKLVSEAVNDSRNANRVEEYRKWAEKYKKARTLLRKIKGLNEEEMHLLAVQLTTTSFYGHPELEKRLVRAFSRIEKRQKNADQAVFLDREEGSSYTFSAQGLVDYVAARFRLSESDYDLEIDPVPPDFVNQVRIRSELRISFLQKLAIITTLLTAFFIPNTSKASTIPVGFMPPIDSAYLHSEGVREIRDDEKNVWQYQKYSNLDILTAAAVLNATRESPNASVDAGVIGVFRNERKPLEERILAATVLMLKQKDFKKEAGDFLVKILHDETKPGLDRTMAAAAYARLIDESSHKKTHKFAMDYLVRVLYDADKPYAERLYAASAYALFKAGRDYIDGPNYKTTIEYAMSILVSALHDEEAPVSHRLIAAAAYAGLDDMNFGDTHEYAIRYLKQVYQNPKSQFSNRVTAAAALLAADEYDSEDKFLALMLRLPSFDKKGNVVNERTPVDLLDAIQNGALTDAGAHAVKEKLKTILDEGRLNHDVGLLVRYAEVLENPTAVDFAEIVKLVSAVLPDEENRLEFWFDIAKKVQDPEKFNFNSYVLKNLLTDPVLDPAQVPDQEIMEFLIKNHPDQELRKQLKVRMKESQWQMVKGTQVVYLALVFMVGVGISIQQMKARRRSELRSILIELWNSVQTIARDPIYGPSYAICFGLMAYMVIKFGPRRGSFFPGSSRNIERMIRAKFKNASPSDLDQARTIVKELRDKIEKNLERPHFEIRYVLPAIIQSANSVEQLRKFVESLGVWKDAGWFDRLIGGVLPLSLVGRLGEAPLLVGNPYEKPAIEKAMKGIARAIQSSDEFREGFETVVIFFEKLKQATARKKYFRNESIISPQVAWEELLQKAHQIRMQHGDFTVSFQPEEREIINNRYTDKVLQHQVISVNEPSVASARSVPTHNKMPGTSIDGKVGTAQTSDENSSGSSMKVRAELRQASSRMRAKQERLFTERAASRRIARIDRWFQHYHDDYDMNWNPEFFASKHETFLDRIKTQLRDFEIENEAIDIAIEQSMSILIAGVPGGIIRAFLKRFTNMVHRHIYGPVAVEEINDRMRHFKERIDRSLESAASLDERRRLMKGYRLKHGYLWIDNVRTSFEELPVDHSTASTVKVIGPREMKIHQIAGYFENILHRKRGLLTDQKDHEILKFLVGRLTDSDPWVVKAAVWGINRIADRMDPVLKQFILERYYEILSGNHSEVARGSIARSIREVFNPQSLDVALEMLKTEQTEWVQTYLVEVIQTIVSQSDKKSLRYKHSRDIIEQLLEKAVGDPDAKRSHIMLRVGSIKALAELLWYDPEVLDRLKEMVLTEPDSTIQEAAMWALARLHVATPEGMAQIDSLLETLTAYLESSHAGRKNVFLEQYARQLLFWLQRLSSNRDLKAKILSMKRTNPDFSLTEKIILGALNQIEKYTKRLKLLEHANWIFELFQSAIFRRARSGSARTLTAYHDRLKAQAKRDAVYFSGRAMNPVILLDIDAILPKEGDEAAKASESDHVFDILKSFMDRGWSVVATDRYREERDAAHFNVAQGAEMKLKSKVLRQAIKFLASNRPIRIPSKDWSRGKRHQRMSGLLVPVPDEPIVVLVHGPELWMVKDIMPGTFSGIVSVGDYKDASNGVYLDKLIDAIEKKANGRIVQREPSRSELRHGPEDFVRDETARMVRELVGTFYKKSVYPFAHEIDKGNIRIEDQILEEAAQAGLFGLAIPEEFGGSGLSPILKIIADIIGWYINPSVALSIGVHNSVVKGPIQDYGTEEQKKKYLTKLASGELIGGYALTELEAGSQALSKRFPLQTTAVPVEVDGKQYYKLNGTKRFITNARFAGVFVGFAMLGDERRVFIIDRDLEGVSVGEDEQKSGLKGSSTADLILQDVLVPAENLIPGDGIKIGMSTMSQGRLSIAASALGGSMRIFDDTLEYSKLRKQFGGPIWQFGGVKQTLAEMAADLYAQESVVYAVASLLTEGKVNAAFESAVAKVFVTEKFNHIAQKGVKTHGGAGYISDTPTARIGQDAIVTEIFEGMNDVLYSNVIAALYLKKLMTEGNQVLNISDYGQFYPEIQKLSSLIGQTGKVILGKFGTLTPENQDEYMAFGKMASEFYAIVSAVRRTRKITSEINPDDPKLKHFLDVTRLVVARGTKRIRDEASHFVDPDVFGVSSDQRKYFELTRGIAEHLVVNPPKRIVEFNASNESQSSRAELRLDPVYLVDLTVFGLLAILPSWFALKLTTERYAKRTIDQLYSPAVQEEMDANRSFNVNFLTFFYDRAVHWVRFLVISFLHGFSAWVASYYAFAMYYPAASIFWPLVAAAAAFGASGVSLWIRDKKQVRQKITVAAQIPAKQIHGKFELNFDLVFGFDLRELLDGKTGEEQALQNLRAKVEEQVERIAANKGAVPAEVGKVLVPVTPESFASTGPNFKVEGLRGQFTVRIPRSNINTMHSFPLNVTSVYLGGQKIAVGTVFFEKNKDARSELRSEGAAKSAFSNFLASVPEDSEKWKSFLREQLALFAAEWVKLPGELQNFFPEETHLFQEFTADNIPAVNLDNFFKLAAVRDAVVDFMPKLNQSSSLPQNAEAVQIPGFNGALLDGWVIRAADSKQENHPAFLILPPWGDDISKYGKLAELLHQEFPSFHVIGLDYTKDPNLETILNTGGIAESFDIEAVIRALSRFSDLKIDPSKITGIGYSMGANTLAILQKRTGLLSHFVPIGLHDSYASVLAGYYENVHIPRIARIVTRRGYSFIDWTDPMIREHAKRLLIEARLRMNQFTIARREIPVKPEDDPFLDLAETASSLQIPVHFVFEEESDLLQESVRDFYRALAGQMNESGRTAQYNTYPGKHNKIDPASLVSDLKTFLTSRSELTSARAEPKTISASSQSAMMSELRKQNHFILFVAGSILFWAGCLMTEQKPVSEMPAETPIEQIAETSEPVTNAPADDISEPAEIQKQPRAPPKSEFETLLEALETGNDDERWDAAKTLSRSANSAASGTFLKALQDSNSLVRREAIIFFRYHHDPRAPKVLIELYRKELDLGIRSDIVETLGILQSAEAVSFLIQRIKREDGAAFYVLKRALVRIGVQAIEPLIDAIRFEYNKELAAKYEETLREIFRNPDAAEQRKKAEKHWYEAVRRAALGITSRSELRKFHEPKPQASGVDAGIYIEGLEKVIRANRFSALRYDRTKKRWVMTSILIDGKKRKGLLLSRKQLDGVNLAFSTLHQKLQKEMTEKSNARIIFVKGLMPILGNHMPWVQRPAGLSGFSKPDFILDRNAAYNPLALLDQFEYEIRRKRLMAGQFSPAEKRELIRNPNTFDLRVKFKQVYLEAHAQLIQDNVINSRDELSFYDSTQRTRLLELVILQAAQEATQVRYRSVENALKALDEAAKDGNHSGHQVAIGILALHASDIAARLIKKSDNESIKIAALDYIASALIDQDTASPAIEITGGLHHEIRNILTNSKNPRLKAAALQLFTVLIYVQLVDSNEKLNALEYHYANLELVIRSLIPTIRQMALTEKNALLRSHAIIFFLALSLRYPQFRGSRRTLKRLAPELERYVLEGKDSNMTQTGILVLEHLWRQLDKNPERFETFISRYIFGENHAPTGIRRTETYWAGKLAHSEISEKMPTLDRILANNDQLSRFLTFLSVMRLAYPYSMINGSYERPIAWAKKNQKIFKLDELRIAFVSESYRRHIIFTEDQSLALEIKFPGERASSGDVSKIHVTLAEKLRQQPKGETVVSEPLFFIGLKGLFNLYGPRETSIEYKEFPLGIVGFRYQDSKRLRNVLEDKELWQAFVEEAYGPSDKYQQKAYVRIAADLIIFALKIHELGYQASTRRLTDLHLENFALLPDGHVFSVADFGIYSRSGSRLTKFRKRKETSGLLAALTAYKSSLISAWDNPTFVMEVVDAVLVKLLTGVTDPAERTEIILRVFGEVRDIFEKVGISPLFEDALVRAWDVNQEPDGYEVRQKIAKSIISRSVIAIGIASDAWSALRYDKDQERLITSPLPDDLVHRFWDHPELLQPLEPVLLSDKEVNLLDKAFKLLPEVDRNQFTSDPNSMIVLMKGMDAHIAESTIDFKRLTNPHAYHDLVSPRFFFDQRLIKDPFEFMKILHNEIKLRNAILQSLTEDEIAMLKNRHLPAELQSKIMKKTQETRDLQWDTYFRSAGKQEPNQEQLSLLEDLIVYGAQDHLHKTFESPAEALLALAKSLGELKGAQKKRTQDFLFYIHNEILSLILLNPDADLDLRISAVVYEIEKAKLESFALLTAEPLARHLERIYDRHKNVRLRVVILRFLAIVHEQVEREMRDNLKSGDNLVKTRYVVESIAWRMAVGVLKNNKSKRVEKEIVKLLLQLLRPYAAVSQKPNHGQLRLLLEEAVIYINQNIEKDPSKEKNKLLALAILSRQIPIASDYLEAALLRYIFDSDDIKGIRMRKSGYPASDAIQPFEQSMPTLIQILKNKQYLARFMVALSILREAFPYHVPNSHDFNEDLLETVETSGAVRLKELLIAPLMHEYSSHLVSTEDGRNVLRLVIPGDSVRHFSNHLRKNHVGKRNLLFFIPILGVPFLYGALDSHRLSGFAGYRERASEGLTMKEIRRREMMNDRIPSLVRTILTHFGQKYDASALHEALVRQDVNQITKLIFSDEYYQDFKQWLLNYMRNVFHMEESEVPDAFRRALKQYFEKKESLGRTEAAVKKSAEGSDAQSKSRSELRAGELSAEVQLANEITKAVTNFALWKSSEHKMSVSRQQMQGYRDAHREADALVKAGIKTLLLSRERAKLIQARTAVQQAMNQSGVTAKAKKRYEFYIGLLNQATENRSVPTHNKTPDQTSVEYPRNSSMKARAELRSNQAYLWKSKITLELASPAGKPDAPKRYIFEIEGRKFMTFDDPDSAIEIVGERATDLGVHDPFLSIMITELLPWIFVESFKNRRVRQPDGNFALQFPELDSGEKDILESEVQVAFGIGSQPSYVAFGPRWYRLPERESINQIVNQATDSFAGDDSIEKRAVPALVTLVKVLNDESRSDVETYIEQKFGPHEFLKRMLTSERVTKNTFFDFVRRNLFLERIGEKWFPYGLYTDTRRSELRHDFRFLLGIEREEEMQKIFDKIKRGDSNDIEQALGSLIDFIGTIPNFLDDRKWAELRKWIARNVVGSINVSSFNTAGIQDLLIRFYNILPGPTTLALSASLDDETEFGERIFILTFLLAGIQESENIAKVVLRNRVFQREASRPKTDNEAQLFNQIHQAIDRKIKDQASPSPAAGELSDPRSELRIAFTDELHPELLSREFADENSIRNNLIEVMSEPKTRVELLGIKTGEFIQRTMGKMQVVFEKTGERVDSLTGEHVIEIEFNVIATKVHTESGTIEARTKPNSRLFEGLNAGIVPEIKIRFNTAMTNGIRAVNARHGEMDEIFASQVPDLASGLERVGPIAGHDLIFGEDGSPLFAEYFLKRFGVLAVVTSSQAEEDFLDPIRDDLQNGEVLIVAQSFEEARLELRKRGFTNQLLLVSEFDFVSDSVKSRAYQMKVFSRSEMRRLLSVVEEAAIQIRSELRTAVSA